MDLLGGVHGLNVKYGVHINKSKRFDPVNRVNINTNSVTIEVPGWKSDLDIVKSIEEAKKIAYSEKAILIIKKVMQKP